MFDDLSGVHHHHVVGDVGDHSQIVGDEDHRHVLFPLQGVQEFDDLGLGGHIEGGGGLIGDEKLG